MIYLLYGTDSQRAGEKRTSLIDSLLAKKPDASLFALNDENTTEAAIEELVGGQGLFEKKYIVSCTGLCRKDDIKSFVVDKLSEIADSDNVFVFVEDKLDAKTKKKFEKYAAKVQTFDKKEEPKSSFSLFALTDSLGERNKKKLWTQYQEALMNGSSPEEIHGILFWQVKSMLLAASVQTPEEADMKPFPFKKAKQFLRNYSKDELCSLSSNLQSATHAARMGQATLEEKLEEVVLSI